MDDLSPIDKSFRRTGRIIGAFLAAGGSFLAIMAVADFRDGCGEVGIALVGGFLMIFGCLLMGVDRALGRFRRRRRARRLAKKLTALLGSPATAHTELSISWLGPWNGTPVALSWSLEMPATQVAVQIPGGSPGTLRILPNQSRGGRLIGGRTIPTGHPDFDRTFLARSEPVTLLQDLFADARRDRVARALLDLPDGPSARVILTLGDVRLRIPRVLDRPEALPPLIAAAQTFADAIGEAARATGYSILSVGTGTSGRCLICVCALESDVVLCIRCRTPHHLGCWDYAGECATFACGGRRWIHPGVVR